MLPLLITTFLMLGAAMTALPASAADWELVWSDDFDHDGLPDPKKWDYEIGFVRNNELQYYTRERKKNARVENGMLVIEAVKERFRNPAYHPGSKDAKAAVSREFADYTSASLITKGKAAWCRGRIEVRAKLPAGRGMWPAIWMLGSSIGKLGWPACGEIDIMENVGFDPTWIHGTVHTAKYNHVKGTQKGGKVEVKSASSDFHVYAIEWDAERIDFLVDDQKYFTFANEHSGADAWPFDAEHYLILNIAVGGSWGGQKGIDDSVFPQQMLVDYVRVYRR